MPVRNGLLVKLTTLDDVEGWGEAWCNFPPRGNLSRLFLIEDVIAPMLLGRKLDRFDQCRPVLERDLGRLARHTGEPGPFAHCFAAIDTALADIAARAQGRPLASFLAGAPKAEISVYASTPDVSRLEASIGEVLADGHVATKLKIGFDRATDMSLLRRFRDLAGGQLAVMADANQNWCLSEAKEAVAALAEFDLGFIEEPIAADAPQDHWAELTAVSPIPIAAGENITSALAFRDYTHLGGLTVLQPDVAKWGGVSGTYAVGSEIHAAGRTCAMHYMGTAVGLAASAHVLAAVGGTGPLELDANPNPLRTELGEIDLGVTNGKMQLPRGEGIGFVPDPEALKRFEVAQADVH